MDGTGLRLEWIHESRPFPVSGEWNIRWSLGSLSSVDPQPSAINAWQVISHFEEICKDRIGSYMAEEAPGAYRSLGSSAL